MQKFIVYDSQVSADMDTFWHDTGIPWLFSTHWWIIGGLALFIVFGFVWSVKNQR